MLGLRFKNNFNDKCNVFIRNLYGKLQMKIADGEYQPYNTVELGEKIIIKLEN